MVRKTIGLDAQERRSMSKWLNEDFLLQSDYAKTLYHGYCEHMPIFDFHNHLDAKAIYEDRVYDSITSFWLIDEEKHGDHYKWRLMRAAGVDERYITGDASPKEKFLMWMKTLRMSIGNPLYEWSLLELKRYFGLEDPLNDYTDEELYDVLNKKLPSLSVRTLLKKSNVTCLATTNDLLEDLKSHRLLKDWDIKVVPTFRPDRLTNIQGSKEYIDYIHTLEKITGIVIDSYASLLDAVEKRLLFFKEMGSFISDHSIESLYYSPLSQTEMDAILSKALKGIALEEKETLNFKSNLIVSLARLYKKHGFAMQLHLKALRNNSKRMFLSFGPDAGYDAIAGGERAIVYLSKMLSKLDETEELPKTISYSLDPSDYQALLALLYCFQDGKTKGKMQLGAAWWFNDNKEGMENQLQTLMNGGLLSTFVGMVTDSRSFLSFARHEYFRRILCNYLGSLMEEGRIPPDVETIGKMAEDICYNNAKEYFWEDK